MDTRTKTLCCLLMFGLCGQAFASPPISSGPVVTNGYGSFVDSPFNLSAGITDDVPITSCEATKDGVNWSPGTVSGSTPTAITCQASLTCADTESLSVNARATDALGATGTASAAARTCDTVAPTSSDNAPAGWQSADVTVTMTAIDAGSGVSHIIFCRDTSNSCDPNLFTSNPRSESFTTPAGTVKQEYLRYKSRDNLLHVEATVHSALIRIDKELATSSASASASWQASDVTATLSASDGSGSGIAAIEHCVDTTNSCTPSTPGTSVLVTCAAGSFCVQSLRHRANDVAGNIGNTSASIISIDKQAPSGGSISYPNGNTSSPISVSLANGTDGGSGLGTKLLQRSQATLQGNTCRTFGAWSTIATNPASPYSDAVPAKTCNQYRYYVSDQVGNNTVYTSPNIAKVH